MTNPEDVVRWMVDAYNAQSLDRLVDLYGDDAVIVAERTHRGTAEIQAHFQDLWSRFGHARLEEARMHPSGDTVLLEVVHRLNTPGGAAELPMAMVFRVRDGRIVEDRAYVAPAPFAELMGASP